MDNLSLQVLESEVRFCDLDSQSALYRKDIKSSFSYLLFSCFPLFVCSTCFILIVNICADVSEQNPFCSVLVQQAEEQGCS